MNLKNFTKNQTNLIYFLILAGIMLRFISLASPHLLVFDEVYFAKFAAALLHHKVETDIHPPLGKAIIASGIAIFGNNSFGYRFMVALFSSLTLLILPNFFYNFFKSNKTATLAFALFSLHGLFFLYGRLALLETFMLFFSILCLKFLQDAKTANKSKQQTILLLLSGICAGLAVSIKWIGLGIIPAAILWWLFLSNKSDKPSVLKPPKWLLFIAFIIIPVLVYLAQFLIIYPPKTYIKDIKSWHTYAWHYNQNLATEHVTHPYGSLAYTWPFESRPIWFYFQQSDNKLTTTGIIALGNPAIWWASTIAIIVAIYLVFINFIKHRFKFSDRNKRLITLLFAWLIYYLPWFGIKRVIFMYHYFMPAFFATLILAELLEPTLNKNGYKKDTTIVFLSIAIYLSIFWLPLWNGLPVPTWFYEMHMWFNSWI